MSFLRLSLETVRMLRLLGAVSLGCVLVTSANADPVPDRTATVPASAEFPVVDAEGRLDIGRLCRVEAACTGGLAADCEDFVSRNPATPGEVSALRRCLSAPTPCATAAACLGMADWGVAVPNRKALVFESPEFNFRYYLPAGRYRRLDPPPLEITLAMASHDGRIAFFLRAMEAQVTSGSQGEFAAELLEAMRLQMGADARESSVSIISGIDGRRIATTTKQFGGGEIVFWVGAANGFAYVLAVVGMDGPAVLREADALFPRFERIDAERPVAPPANAYGTFHSARFGYSLALADPSWQAWTPFERTYPAAETGGVSADGECAFVVIPFYHGDPALSLDSLLDVMVAHSGVDLSNRSPLVPWPAAPAVGAVAGATFTFELKGTPTFTGRAALLTASERTVMVSGWCTSPPGDRMELVDRAIESLRLDLPPEEPFRLGQAPPGIVQAHATMHDGLALAAFNLGRFKDAAFHQRRALAAIPTEDRVVGAFMVDSRLGRYQESLSLLEDQPAAMRQSPRVRSWHAWFLSKVGREPEAVTEYHSLFAGGHRDDEDFANYTGLLEQSGRWEDAREAYSSYLKGGESAAIRVKLARALIDRGEARAGLDVIEEQMGDPMSNPDAAFVRVEGYFALDEDLKVIELCRNLVERQIRPGDAHFWKGRAELRLQWLRQAKQSFEASLAATPGDQAVKDWYQHVSATLGEGVLHPEHTAITPVSLPAELREPMDRAATRSVTGDFGAHYVHRVIAVEFAAGKVYKESYYSSVRVDNSAGAEAFSTLRFAFNPTAQSVVVSDLVVRDADGGVVASGDRADYYVLADGQGEQGYSSTLYAPVPRVAPGTTLEFVATIQYRRAPDRLPFSTYFLSATRPIALAAVYYAGSPEILREVRTAADPPTRLSSGLLWVRELPPVVHLEPMQADPRIGASFLTIGDARDSWEELGAQYLKELSSHVPTEESMSDVLDGLGVSGLDPAGRVDAIWSFVQRSFRYKAVAFGVHARIPKSPRKTLSDGFGDCKDLSLLLHRLLRAAAVESHLVLVQSSGAVVKDVPSLDQFDHMIVYLAKGSGDRFIDPTDLSGSRALRVPVGLAGQDAFVLDSGGAHFSKIPEHGGEDYRMEIRRDARLDPEDLTLRVDESVVCHGHAASHFRSILRGVESSRRHDWVRGLLAEHTTGAELLDLRVDGLDLVQEPVTLQLAYRQKGAPHDHDQLVLHVPHPWERYALVVPPVGARKSSFELRIPWSIDSRTEVVAPDSATVQVSGPPERTRDLPSGWWKSSAVTRGSRATETLRGGLHRGVYGAAEYEAHRELFDDALRAATDGLRLRLSDESGSAHQ